MTRPARSTQGAGFTTLTEGILNMGMSVLSRASSLITRALIAMGPSPRPPPCPRTAGSVSPDYGGGTGRYNRLTGAALR